MDVLLLHSSGLSGRQWKRLVTELGEQGLHAVAPDLTGHGLSDPWLEPVPFSFRTDVERVGELLRGGRPLHVVGHSYGGFVALQVALGAPELVRSLVLFDPVAFGVLDRTADADAFAVLDAFDPSWGPSEAHRERWLEAFVEFWGGKGEWAALPEPMRAEFRRVGWVVREGVRTLSEDVTPAAAYAAAVTCPVTLITGEASPLPARRVMEHLSRALPAARLTTIPNAGHLAPVTHSKAVNAAILEAIGHA